MYLMPHAPKCSSAPAEGETPDAGAPEALGLFETKLATLVDVREHTEGAAVELWLKRSGRVVVRAFNECGNNYTDIDLLDLLNWTKGNPLDGMEDVARGIAALSAVDIGGVP